MLRVGGAVLCGGRSSRMGYPKAVLPFGPELMLQRVVRLLGTVVSPIVVVAAQDQPLPQLPPEVLLARDEREGLGPLEGLKVGLKLLVGQVDAAYVTSCDMPLLQPEFVSQMVARLGESDIAVPFEDQREHPLAAVYRTTVVSHIVELLAADRLRLIYLFERVPTIRVPVDELRVVDPELRTLVNVNHATDYCIALEACGFGVNPQISDLLK